MRAMIQKLRDVPSIGTTALCALFGVMGVLSPNPMWAKAFYGASFAVGGYDKLWDGLKSLSRGRFEIDLLMVLAAVGSAAIGHWEDGAMLIFIFALSGTLEDIALGRTERSIAALMKMRPDQARVRRDDEEVWVGIESVEIGETVIVKSGENIPVDGAVVSGGSSVNQATITGESLPVNKTEGDKVYAGTMNGQGFLEIRVECPATDTVFSRILKLVEQAQSDAPPTHAFLKRFESVYAWGVVLATAGCGSCPDGAAATRSIGR
ncbi:MAG: HAD-IC family P-type ATPase [Candidatus Poribacteria bacterium]|nr:HAD-IC family P-type ATPase [Candidatus Poribacteria bacterium]